MHRVEYKFYTPYNMQQQVVWMVVYTNLFSLIVQEVTCVNQARI